MKSLLIELDDEAWKEFDLVAPPEKCARSAFIRRAIRDALSRSEFDRIEEAYRRQPFEPAVVDEWPEPEGWRGE